MKSSRSPSVRDRSGSGVGVEGSASAGVDQTIESSAGGDVLGSLDISATATEEK